MRMCFVFVRNVHWKSAWPMPESVVARMKSKQYVCLACRDKTMWSMF